MIFVKQKNCGCQSCLVITNTKINKNNYLKIPRPSSIATLINILLLVGIRGYVVQEVFKLIQQQLSTIQIYQNYNNRKREETDKGKKVRSSRLSLKYTLLCRWVAGGFCKA